MQELLKLAEEYITNKPNENPASFICNPDSRAFRGIHTRSYDWSRMTKMSRCLKGRDLEQTASCCDTQVVKVVNHVMKSVTGTSSL